MSERKSKWHPPTPRPPRILHLPQRNRRPKTTKMVAGKNLAAKEQLPESRTVRRGKLEALFDRERLFCPSVPVVLLNSEESDRRKQVEEQDGMEGGKDFWKFQAEILRAECKFLRIEKEVTMKKLERNRLQMEQILQSAAKALALGRKNVQEGNLGVLLEQEVKHLESKLLELQRSSRSWDFNRRKCGNFDRQASALQRKLEKIEELPKEKICVSETQGMADAGQTTEICTRFEKNFASDRRTRFANVESLRRRMESVSRGMLERMEEYGYSMLSNSTNRGPANISRRAEVPEPAKGQQEGCTGNCKAIVRKIVEHVRAETEQWSQLQGMLGQVRDEMEELQSCKDFWEGRALESSNKQQSLQIQVLEWKQKAFNFESKASQLQKQISELQMQHRRSATNKSVDFSSLKAPPDIRSVRPINTKGFQMSSTNASLEKEKRVLICHLKENSHISKMQQENPHISKININKDGSRRGSVYGSIQKRLPLQEIGNSSSPLSRQSRSVFPIYLRKPVAMKTTLEP